MQLGIVIGKVISTIHAGQKKGVPLLVVQPVDEKLKATGRSFACSDSLNARSQDLVLTCSSSSARKTAKTKEVCTDNTIVAIVDSISQNKQVVYDKDKS